VVFAKPQAAYSSAVAAYRREVCAIRLANRLEGSLGLLTKGDK